MRAGRRHKADVTKPHVMKAGLTKADPDPDTRKR